MNGPLSDQPTTSSLDQNITDGRPENPQHITNVLIDTESDTEDHVKQNTAEEMTSTRQVSRDILGDSRCSTLDQPYDDDDDDAISVTPIGPQFPNEIISNIVRQLSRLRDFHQCTLINWQVNVITTPLLYETLNLDIRTKFQQFVSSHHYTTAITTTTTTIHHHYRYIKNLKISGAHRNDPYLKRIIQCLHHLEHFEVRIIPSPKNITASSLHYLPYHCRQLTSLTLNQSVLSPDLFDSLAQFFPILRHLTLTLPDIRELSKYYGGTPHEVWPSPNGFDLIVSSCPLLETLELHGCKHRLDITLLTAITRWHGLKRLVLNEWDTTPMQLLFTMAMGNASSTSSSCWPHLTHFDVDGDCSIDDTLLTEFLQRYPHLQHFGISWAILLTDASLVAITTYLGSSLTSLKLEGAPDITKNGVYNMIFGCPRLSRLLLNYCGDFATYDCLVYYPEDLDIIRKKIGDEGGYSIK